MLRRLQLMPDISRGLSIIHADEGSNGVPFSSFHTLPASFPIFLREENISVDISVECVRYILSTKWSIMNRMKILFAGYRISIVLNNPR